MNLRKRPLTSDNEKVADPLLDKRLKLWPEKVKRKRTLKLLSKSLEKNAGCCLKKCATGRDEVAKPLQMRGSICLKEHLGKFVKCPESLRKKRSFSYHNHFSKTVVNTLGWCIKEGAMGWDEVAKPLDDNDRKMQFSKAMDSTSELQGFSKNSGVRLKEINEGSCKTKRVRCPNTSTSPNDSIIKVVNPSFKKYPKHLGIEGALCLKEHLAKYLNWPESVRKKRSSSGFNRLSVTLENTPGSICLGKRHKRGREQFGSLFTHSLPEEVVEEILSRLPVKSVA